MKEFIKENKIIVIVLSIIFVIVLVIGIWGIKTFVSSNKSKNDSYDSSNNNSQTDKKDNKYDAINDAKGLVDSATIERLYNYVLGMGYNSNTGYISEAYKDSIVTVDNLSDDTIIRTSLNQVINCNKDKVSVSDIKKKIKQIFGSDKNVNFNTTITVNSNKYNCDSDKCLAEKSNVCNPIALDNGYKLVSVMADFNDDNILYLYEEKANSLMYRHTFKKDNNEYYWYSTEPITK